MTGMGRFGTTNGSKLGRKRFNWWACRTVGTLIHSFLTMTNSTCVCVCVCMCDAQFDFNKTLYSSAHTAAMSVCVYVPVCQGCGWMTNHVPFRPGSGFPASRLLLQTASKSSATPFKKFAAVLSRAS